jgi:hypothetical protein
MSKYSTISDTSIAFWFDFRTCKNLNPQSHIWLVRQETTFDCKYCFQVYLKNSMESNLIEEEQKTSQGFSKEKEKVREKKKSNKST